MTGTGGGPSPDDRSDRPQDPVPAPPAPVEPMPPAPEQGTSQYGAPQYGTTQYGAPKPGVIPLRPLGLGEILDGAITAMRTYPKQMLGVSAIVSAISNLLIFGLILYLVNGTGLLYGNLPPLATEEDIAFENLRITLILAIPSVVITVLAGMFLSGVLTIVMGKAVLGQPITTGEAWRRLRPRFGALIGLSLLYTLIVLAGSLALVIPGVWLYVLFSLASTALILEGTGLGKAFGRSKDLVRGAWWRTFGILVLAGVIGTVVGYIVEIPFNLANGGLNQVTGTGPAPSFEVAMLLTAVAGIIAQTFTLPFSSGVTTLIYLDRRMRREGLDIELARQAGVAPPPPAQGW
ncbi:MAG: hypothetical protein ABW215_07590 [Kibdelosporangium sp.]